MSPFRLTGGGDPYRSLVTLQLLFNGTNGSTTFTDSSPNAYTATRVGSPTISTAQSKYGGASGLFGGSADALSFAHNTALNLVGGDFTIRAWGYVSSLAAQMCLIQKDQQFGVTFPSYAVFVNANGSIAASVGTGSSAGYNQTITSSAGLVTTGNFYHLEFVQYTVGGTTTLKLFLNGVVRASATRTGTPSDGGKALLIGRHPSGGGAADMWWNGYIDDLEITKGVARHTADFTPPSAQLPTS